jgi:hypothetical protein
MLDAAQAGAKLVLAARSEKRLAEIVDSIINTTLAKIAPLLGAKIAAKQADRQQYDQPPSRDRRAASARSARRLRSR